MLGKDGGWVLRMTGVNIIRCTKKSLSSSSPCVCIRMGHLARKRKCVGGCGIKIEEHDSSNTTEQ